MFIKLLVSALIVLGCVANAHAEFSAKEKPNAADISDTIKGLIGEKDVAHDQSKEQAIQWFVNNYDSIINSEATIVNVQKCHDTAMNNSELIGCAFMEARRNFARTYGVFVDAKALVGTLADSTKQDALMDHLEKSKTAWVQMVTNACELQSHQMLGGTGSYLILFGCMSSSAASIRTDLLRGMNVVNAIKNKQSHYVLDDLLESMKQPGFQQTIKTQNVDSWSFDNFNEKYQKLLTESGEYMDVEQYRELPRTVYNQWNTFQVEYCSGYGSLVAMYAEALEKGSPYSVIPLAGGVCNQNQARARANDWLQDARDTFGN